MVFVVCHEKSTNSHDPRVGTGTTGPGEAVFAIGGVIYKEIELKN